jgi:hypothetical protein
VSKEAREMVLLFVFASAIVALAFLGAYCGFLRNRTVFVGGLILMIAPFLNVPQSKPSNRGIKFGMTVGTALFMVSFWVGPIYIGKWVLS